MDNNTQEQVRVVAEYNGWVRAAKTDVCDIYTRSGGKAKYLDGMQYHTSFDWLIPVAKKVVEELRTIYEPALKSNEINEDWIGYEAKYEVFENAEAEIFGALKSFDITLLFPAVVEAIELLKKYKTK